MCFQMQCISFFYYYANSCQSLGRRSNFVPELQCIVATNFFVLASGLAHQNVYRNKTGITAITKVLSADVA